MAFGLSWYCHNGFASKDMAEYEVLLCTDGRYSVVLSSTVFLCNTRTSIDTGAEMPGLK